MRKQLLFFGINFEKFSLGGLHNFAGLYEDEILGDKLFQGEMELRYKINGPLYLYGRYNVGNIWGKLESIKISELRNSVGAGLAFKTPFGPIAGWYGRTDQRQHHYDRFVAQVEIILDRVNRLARFPVQVVALPQLVCVIERRGEIVVDLVGKAGDLFAGERHVQRL